MSAAAVRTNGNGVSPSRRDKIRLIFDRFDANDDGGLDRQEMAALVAAVNPSVNFTPDQISSIIDEVFRSYSDFVPNPNAGLSLSGLIQTYNDGAGDVDHDFAALFHAPTLSTLQNPNSNPNPRGVGPRWVSSPNHGISYESTWKAIEDLEMLIKSRIRGLKLNRNVKDSIFFDGFSDNGWSTDFSLELDKRRGLLVNENSSEFRAFLKDLKEISARIDQLPTTEEAFDGHMAVGRTLHDRKFLPEAVKSFRRAIGLRPSDVRPHYRLGNTLMALQRSSEAKESYATALRFAETDSVKWSELLPQVHVNIGIVMKGEGLLINASEHYREAAILCPTHYRALKLLGSVLSGVGEYGPAEKALEEAVLLNPEFADAHCDLGSVLHAMGEEERAILSFQRAIDLKSDHLDALYNLGGLLKDVGRFQRASEMYARVLAIRPDHWRAQLNRAASLLGTEEPKEAKKALNEAFKMTNRVELYDAIEHLKQLQRKPRGEGTKWIVEDASKFKSADENTTDRKQLVDALWIRELQKATKLDRCNVNLLRREMEGIDIPLSYARNRRSGRSIRKSELEIILRKLLHFLRPETFQGIMKSISEKICTVLDVTGSGKVDLGMFFAIIAPICEGPPEMRKRAAFECLLSRALNSVQGQIARADATVYLRYLRVIYFPSEGFTDLMGIHGGEEVEEDIGISFSEFVSRFDDTDSGFGVMNILVKLEAGDKGRKHKHSCGVCQYRISGLMFKEVTSRFYLCSSCYCECKVPFSSRKDEYKFKQYQIE